MSLTAIVHDIVSDFHDVSQECVEHIITEALFQIAKQVRRGNVVELEYLGRFSQFTAELGGAVTIDYTPDPDLRVSA